MRVQGYAISGPGGPYLRTVSPTERAAKVNGIVVLGGTMVSADWGDPQIDRAWELCVARASVPLRLVRVTVSEAA